MDISYHSFEPSSSSSSSSSSFSTQQLHHKTSVHPDPSHAPSDLTATISLIKNLTGLAESSIKSICEFFSFTPPSSSIAADCLGLCPFDSRHLMPPESLFRHSLTCSSGPGTPLSDLGFLDSLRYPKSLKSEEELLKENLFVRPLPEAEADICFSLEGELGEIDSNFFYKDCPGVIAFPELDAAGRTFTLPAILSAECANFINGIDEAGGDLEPNIGILPSDFWALRSELKGWSNFPVAYSCTVLRVAAGLQKADELSLKRWAILNSPNFGILIDAAIRDHVFLLLKLCLKAIRREALYFLKLVLKKNGFLDPRAVNCECPRLVSSLTWLTSQISVLYGEVNGKLFVMGLLKESLLLAGRSLMLFGRKEENATRDAKVMANDLECSGNEFKLELSKLVEYSEVKGQKSSEYSCSGKVFVSQVASAIAAFHERFLLEQRIKALRFTQQLTRLQRINEYISTSTRASQKREKRPNYRPLLEHDGLLWQRSNKHDSDKFKTREELLAEERDYKRRRMSYRGKKVKRNPIQVLRDIIEEHMKEINMAGGIGCNVKLTSENAVIPSFELQSSLNDAYESKINKSLHYASQLAAKPHGYYSSNDGSSISLLPKNHHETQYELYDDQHKYEKCHQEMPTYNRSRSSSYHSSYPRSSERYSKKMDPPNWRPLRDKYDKMGSKSSYSSEDYDSRSTLTSKPQEGTRYGHNCTPDSRRRHDIKSSEKQWMDSSSCDTFEDRYDPSRSYNNCDTFYKGSSA